MRAIDDRISLAVEARIALQILLLDSHGVLQIPGLRRVQANNLPATVGANVEILAMGDDELLAQTMRKYVI